jgi:PAS domain-containing protein
MNTDYLGDRRKRTPAATPLETLDQIPARVLLDRMPTPTIGLGTDGGLVYANPALASMLGYRNVSRLIEDGLSAMLVGHALRSPEECIATLRRGAAGKIIDWCHADGFTIHTAISSPLLQRATDPLLIFTVADITELLWMEAPHRKRA